MEVNLGVVVGKFRLCASIRIRSNTKVMLIADIGCETRSEIHINTYHWIEPYYAKLHRNTGSCIESNHI